MLEQAHRDSLTSFFLREALIPFLEELIRDSSQANKSFSVALLDLDHFKRFNDKYGHAFGDEILKYATSTLRLTFYENQAQFFRYGGDEFVAVFPHHSAKETYQLIRQCQYNLRRRPFLYQNKFYRVTLSCGIAGFPADAPVPEVLIQKADEAMYFSKRSGRNITTLFNRMSLLRLRNFFIVIGSMAFLAASGATAYHFAFKKIIKPTVSQFEHMRIVTKPGHLDTVTLKNGMQFEGKIITETKDAVTLNIYFDKGEGVMSFAKSEIAQLNRASRRAP